MTPNEGTEVEPGDDEPTDSTRSPDTESESPSRTRRKKAAAKKRATKRPSRAAPKKTVAKKKVASKRPSRAAPKKTAEKKKVASKRPSKAAPKKAAAKKAAAKKAAAKKKVASKRPSKAAPKKTAKKKVASKRPSKAAPKKTAEKKVAAKKKVSAKKKVATERPSKAAPKKTATKKVAAEKKVASKRPSEAATKKTAEKKAASKRPSKAAPAKKKAASKRPSGAAPKKVAAKKVAAKKVAAKKKVATKRPSEAAPKKTAKKKVATKRPSEAAPKKSVTSRDDAGTEWASEAPGSVGSEAASGTLSTDKPSAEDAWRAWHAPTFPEDDGAPVSEAEPSDAVVAMDAIAPSVLEDGFEHPREIDHAVTPPPPPDTLVSIAAPAPDGWSDDAEPEPEPSTPGPRSRRNEDLVVADAPFAGHIVAADVFAPRQSLVKPPAPSTTSAGPEATDVAAEPAAPVSARLARPFISAPPSERPETAPPRRRPRPPVLATLPSPEPALREPEPKAETDTDAKLEAEAETEAETETKAEGEIEAENKAETKSQTDPEIETEPEIEAETKIEIEAAKKAETKIEIETDPETETETEPEPETEPETETETETETEIEIEPEPETEPETDPDPDPEIETDPDPDPETDPDPEAPPTPIARVVDPDVDDGTADVVADEPDYLRAPTRSPKRPDADAVRRPRRNRRVALAIAVLAVVVGALITVFPHYLLARARTDSDACFEQTARSGEGAPGACLPPAWVIGYVERLPWFESDALALHAASRVRAARLAYGLATAADPDAEARRAAALEVHALASSPSLLASAPGYDSLLGAFAELTELGMASDDASLRRHAFSAARAAADDKALAALARGTDVNDAPALNLERGATSCLLGQPDEGRRALADADAAHRRKASDGAGLDAARLALFACGTEGAAVDARNVSPKSLPALVALEASRGTVAGLDRARTLLLEPGAGRELGPDARLRLAARVVAAEPPTLRVTLAMLAPAEGKAAGLEPPTSPWTLLEARAVDAVPAAPDAALAAAKHLERLIGEIDDEDPLTCRAAPCPSDAALAAPKEMLGEAIAMLHLDAAIELARRGRAEASLTQARAAFDRYPLPRRHLVAPLLLLLGDAEGALAAYRSAPHAPTSQLGQALALAHLGRFEDARRTAEEGFAAADEAARTRDDEGAAADVTALAWLWAAMALETGKAAAVVDVLGDAQEAELVAIAEWVEIATMPEAHRLPQRYDLTLDELAPAALPAVIHVVSRAVPPSDGVGVWLDRILDAPQRDRPVPLLLARAEAARWRGDEAAADRARAGAETLQALVRTDAGAILATAAHLR